MTNLSLSVLALGLALGSFAGCASTEYQRSTLPDDSRAAMLIQLDDVKIGAPATFPARLSTPSLPATADRLASRVITERGGEARTDVRLCVGSDGEVADVTLIDSSGIDALDAALIAEARTWRYQPLGAATTVCGNVGIGYTVR